jgi:plasmid stabilization system protein ParE
MKVEYRARARDDIADIYMYAALHHGRDAAQQLEHLIRQTTALLAAHPRLAVATDHAGQIRRWPMPQYPYAVFYHIDDQAETVMILRVIDSRRVRDLRRVPRW